VLIFHPPRLFFYAGITKVFNSEWSAAGYLKTAKTFSGFYEWLITPGMLPVTNFLNEWGLTLIGVAMILGVFVRISSVLGATMMVLYYFPILTFPKIGANAFFGRSTYNFCFSLFAFRGFGSRKSLGARGLA
jgi:thiosulfate dehydrogenase [quinone] large subunit